MDLNTLAPKDYVQKAIDIIYSPLEKFGFKRLKSNTIKKKYNGFVCEMHFSSSHYNYVYYEKNKGSVILEVFCKIIMSEVI